MFILTNLIFKIKPAFLPLVYHDVDLNIIAYYGLPIRWNDDQTLGTICVLDSKSNEFEDKYKEMIKIYRKVIEDDLELLRCRND